MRDLGNVVGSEALKTLRGAPVEVTAPAVEEGGVGGLLGQTVLEAEDVFGNEALFPDELASLQVGQRGVDGLGVDIGERINEELAADDGCRLRHVFRPLLQ